MRYSKATTTNALQAYPLIAYNQQFVICDPIESSVYFNKMPVTRLVTQEDLWEF